MNQKPMAALRLAAFFVLSLSASLSLASEREAIEKAVKEFCTAEFNDITEMRLARIHFTKEVGAREKKRKFPVLPGVVEIDADPLVIVSEFGVIKTEEEAPNQAYSIVEYGELGRLVGDGNYGPKKRKLVAKKTVFDETLHLKKIHGQWLVVNPPIPKVGLEVLVKLYESSVKRLAKLPNLEGPQLEAFQYEKEMLEGLKSLK